MGTKRCATPPKLENLHSPLEPPRKGRRKSEVVMRASDIGFFS
ncbi:hypothetical protein [uncultured Thalassospira sp.]|nr:hypothetical protein [uncultured Thalassospira sp.]